MRVFLLSRSDTPGHVLDSQFCTLQCILTFRPVKTPFLSPLFTFCHGHTHFIWHKILFYYPQERLACTHCTSSDAVVRPNSDAAGLNLGSQHSPSLVKVPPSYPGTAYCNRKRFHPGRGCRVSGKGMNAATSPVYWPARISWFLL